MVSKAVALLLSDLGVTKSLSRPHVSNDNPYSEAHFKTLKYRPEFPKNFGSIEDARLFCEGFFQWYNYEHYHSGIAFLTPETVHRARAEACLKARQTVMNKAFEEHPGRFSRRPKVLQLPKEVWINKPQKSAAEVVPLATTYGGVPACV
jgi:putative transposase